MIPEVSPVVRLYPKIELEDGSSIGVKIRQAGRAEVRLDVQAILEPGKLMVLHIEDGNGDCWFRAPVDIHWSQPIPGGTSVGMYLDQPLPEQLLSWPEWDRRESLRYPLDLSARFWWHDSQNGIAARIVNYSANGLGLVCPSRVSLGRQAIIAAGLTIDDIVCVVATPCWQIDTPKGVMIGFELQAGEGKRLGGHLQPP